MTKVYSCFQPEQSKRRWLAKAVWCFQCLEKKMSWKDRVVRSSSEACPNIDPWNRTVL